MTAPGTICGCARPSAARIGAGAGAGAGDAAMLYLLMGLPFSGCQQPMHLLQHPGPPCLTEPQARQAVCLIWLFEI